MRTNDMHPVNAVIITRPDPPAMPGRSSYPLFGRPLVGWILDTLKYCQRVDHVAVSTSDPEVAEIARQAGGIVVPRPTELDDPRSLRVEVLRHAVTWLYHETNLDTGVAIALRASAPELGASTINGALDLLEKRHLREVLSVSPNGVQNDDLRVIHRRELFETALSNRIAVVKTECIDVRSADDIAALQQRYPTRERFDAVRE